MAQPQVLGMVLMEKEHLPPREGVARDGGLEALRQRRNDCEPGQWTRDDRWPNQDPERWLRCCVGYHLPVAPGSALGPRPQEWRQVRAWLRDKRREEDVNALISSLNWCPGSRAPFASGSVPTPRQDLVTARVRELVDRSLPMFAIPGQRVAFMKLLRGRGVYDTRDGGLSLASFFVLCQKSMPTTTAGSPRVETVVTGETRQYLENGMERMLRSRFGDYSQQGQNRGLQQEALFATCARP